MGQIWHGITYMWNLKKKVNLREREGREIVSRSWGMRKQGNVGNRLQIFSYNMNKVSGSNV